MRIGIDVAVITSAYGGIGRYTEQLLHAMLPLLEDDELILFAGNSVPHWIVHLAGHHGYRREEPACPSVKIRRTLFVRRGRALRTSLLVGLAARQLGVQVFHSPDNVNAPLTTGRQVSLVITVHDLIPLLYPQTVSRRYHLWWRAMLRPTVARADRIIAVSRSTADDLANLVPGAGSKTRVIHLGVDPTFGRTKPEDVQDIRRRLQLPSEYILFVGTLEPKKNVPGLLRAYARLREQQDIPPLVIAGQTGWMAEPVFKAVEQLRLCNSVRFVGFVSDRDLPALMTGAMLFVFPSVYEGFGLPVLEAMACGVPVVTSNRSSLPEITAGAAILVDPLDPDSIASGMRAVLEDSELAQRLADLGRQRAREFSWERTACETLELYRELV